MVSTKMIEFKIFVQRGENLAAKDSLFFGMESFFGLENIFGTCSSDPYVEVRFMPHGKCSIWDSSVLFLGKTEVMPQTLNPVWPDRQVFSGQLPLTEISEQAVFHLTLYDQDLESKDDSMGVVCVPITKVAAYVAKDKWYDVEGVHGEAAQGRIQATLKLKESVQDMPEDTTPAEHCYDIQVNVIKAINLAMKDSFMGIKTSSDPYAIVRLNTGHHVHHHQHKESSNHNHHHDKNNKLMGKTEYQSQTINPKWNETFSIRVPIDEVFPQNAHLELTLFDYDDDNEDDPMGVVNIQLESLLKQIKPDKPTASKSKDWYPVGQNSDKKKGDDEEVSGKVQCSLSVSLVVAKAS